MKKIFFYLGLSLNIILFGCIHEVPEKVTQTEQCDKELKYCINLKNFMNNRGWTDNWSGWSGYPTDHTISNGLNTDDSKYQRIDFSSNITSCSPALIGISTPLFEEQSNNVYQMWGEVDEKNDGSFPEPNCRVKSIYPEKNPYEDMTAYAFCSKKGNKTVLICIDQMTDNPAQAEEIFNTFRWTE